jgi:serine protease
LIARGDISFADKVLACENGGGGAAVIYNNADGALSGTLGGVVTNIPSIGVSQADGLALQGSVGQSATVTVGSGDYAFFDGTSMATPHVSAVAGLVWSQFVECTNDQIRAAMNATALDLGAAGRDTAYGNGLVQAKAAVDYLSAGCDGSGGGGGGGGGDTGGGGGPEQCDLLPVGASCSSNDECCSGSCKGKPGRQTCK